MRAMGHQAAAALHQPASIRLVTEQGKCLAIEQDTFPSNPLPDGWEPLGMTDAARTSMRAQEADRLRDRVRELEADLEHALRSLQAAREAGRREERAVTARTLGGRVPSILTPFTGR